MGKLERSLYGTRDAPQIWQEELRGTMEELGYQTCLSNPGMYIHPATGVKALAHVDDVMAIGAKHHLQELQQQLNQKYELKHHILGPGPTDAQEVEFLGRTIKWTESGLVYEAGTKHVETLVKEWQMEGCSVVHSPSSPNDKDGSEDQPVYLDDGAAARYRRSVAICNYLAQDRCDISYASKEVSRWMAQPRVEDEIKLKRLVRYLCHHRRGVYLFK